MNLDSWQFTCVRLCRRGGGGCRHSLMSKMITKGEWHVACGVRLKRQRGKCRAKMLHIRSRIWWILSKR